jgi:tRNA nucleotidyltransferase (CCA-adding enzyme)
VIEEVQPIAQAIRARGGRAIAVGGYVRDHLLGRPEKDLDVEVFGLEEGELASVLRGFGEVLRYGRSFPVLHVVGYEIDFSLAHAATFAEAARRRDLTIHAIGLDLLTGELLDPLGGRDDLAGRVLRAADPRTFGSDPLRGLRVVQVAARYAMEPDAELVALCRALDLSGLPGERLCVEFDKLLRAERPSRGLDLLRETQLLRFFPELAQLESGAWEHTRLAVDAAAALRSRRSGDPGPDDRALSWAALCADAGADAARSLLERLRAPQALVAQVGALVEHRRAPVALVRDRAQPSVYRRLVRQLAEVGVGPELLERAACADRLGQAVPGFLAEIERLAIPPGGLQDAVWGRHLIERGLEPGPEFTRILARCREVQDETGWTDPEAILSRALGLRLT